MNLLRLFDFNLNSELRGCFLLIQGAIIYWNSSKEADLVIQFLVYNEKLFSI